MNNQIVNAQRSAVQPIGRLCRTRFIIQHPLSKTLSALPLGRRPSRLQRRVGRLLPSLKLMSIVSRILQLFLEKLLSFGSHREVYVLAEGGASVPLEY